MSGVDGDATIRANREGFERYQLKTRRFVAVNRIDMTVELFGARFNSPLVLSPIGSSRAFHPEGEVAVALAAQTKGQLQIMSTLSSFSVEDVVKVRGGTTWYQLYTTNNFAATTALVKRAEAAGCPAVAVTVDLPAGRNAVTASRLARTDTRNCAACHTDATADRMRPRAAGTDMGKPMFAGIETRGLGLTSPTVTWDFVKQLRDVTTMKIVIKGLENAGDAELALEHGVDGVIISNHGGRATETGRGTIESVAEAARAVRGRVPILVDGGVRRGTDVFKALALGANAWVSVGPISGA
jgi:4-hydroxymandelate oxidase